MTFSFLGYTIHQLVLVRILGLKHLKPPKITHYAKIVVRLSQVNPPHSKLAWDLCSRSCEIRLLGINLLLSVSSKYQDRIAFGDSFEFRAQLPCPRLLIQPETVPPGVFRVVVSLVSNHRIIHR